MEPNKALVHKSGLCISDVLSLLSFDTGDCFEFKELQLPSPFDFRVVGSCNGILCLVYYDDKHTKYMLYNPLVRHSFWLPNPRHSNHWYGHILAGFGFDAAANDYKIIKFDFLSTEVYSLNSNHWRDIPAPIQIPLPEFSFVFNNVGAFVNEALHWAAIMGYENVVLVFDVKSETFRRFSLPYNFGRFWVTNVFGYGRTSIAVSLQSFETCKVDIIVMKEYGVTESWAHLATVGVEEGERSEVLGFRDKDRVFIRFGFTRLALQKLNGRVDRNLMTVGKLEGFSLHEYVPSLFLLDKQNNAQARV